jgi:hypothetical protein
VVEDGGAKRRCAAILISCLAYLAWLPGHAAAASGPLSPVPGFGTGGVVHAGSGRGFTPYAVAVDSRRRIWVGGSGGSNLAKLVVFRFLPDGRPDRAFGRAGAIRLPGLAWDVELVPDRSGGAYVLGASPEDEESITHLGSDGTPSRRFGTEGTVHLPLAAETNHEMELSHPLVGLPGGGLLAAGRGGTLDERFEESGPLELARLSAAGHRVRSFGGDGVAVLGDPRLRRLRMTDVGVTRDGRILVSGSIPKPPRRYESETEFEAHREAVLVELTRRGRLDRQFGHDGIATPRVPSESKAMLVRSERDGSIIVAGVRTRTNPELPEYGLYRPFVLRLDRDGSLAQRFEPTPVASFGSGYEAAKFASNMSDLLTAAGRLFVAAGGAEFGTAALLTYSSQGGGGTYLRLAPEGSESVTTIAVRGRELVVLATGASESGFLLRAFRVGPTR